MKTLLKSNDPLREKPLVYIYSSFFADTRTYKELNIVASRKLIFETCESCSEMIKKDPDYINVIYNEAINLAFRPKVKFQDICKSIIRYMCCLPRIKDFLIKNPHIGVEMTCHINIDDEDLCEVRYLDPKIFMKIRNVDPEFNLGDNSELSMTLPTRLDFLGNMEMTFLEGLLNRIQPSNGNIVELTYGQFWEIIEKNNDGEEITKDEMDDLINTLLFYNFISIDREYLEKKHTFRFSIIDLSNYYDMFRLSEIKISA